MACTLQATIAGKFALIGQRDEDTDTDTMITNYNTAVTDTASAILGKEHRRKKRQGSKQGDSEGSEESKGGLDRCSMRGD